jgi:16S rRNA (cytidine1402-2'-O)-methyltransferase
VAFDSPFRIRRSLAALAAALPDRPVVLARELTKLHEEVLRGTAAEVLVRLAPVPKGEVTLVIAGCG